MTNLADVLRSKGVQTVGTEHRNVRPGWIGTDCPKCSPGAGKYRLGFEESTGRVNCWMCGTQRGPDMFSGLMRISLRDAIDLWKSLPFRRRRTAAPTISGTLVKPDRVGMMTYPHQKYLKDRGLDADFLEQTWKLQGIGLAPKLAWRIFIPIFDRHGTEVSWTSRSLAEDTDLRYVSASPDEELLPAKSVLYGAHLARHSVVVVEGPVDAWAIGPGAVATLGLATTARQLDLISKYPQRTICFDSSDDAQRRADRLCDNLAAFPGQTSRVRLETGEDAAEADPEEIRELRSAFIS